MSEPPDPGGGDAEPRARSSPPLFTQSQVDIMELDNPVQNRKRAPAAEETSLPSKKTNTGQSSPSIQSTYNNPKFLDTKIKYTDEDSAPFIVHVNKIVSDQASGTALRPIKFGHFLYKINVKNIIKDGVKRVGRNRISIEFKSSNDANAFLEHPALSPAKYEAIIPSYSVTRMGIVRQVPVEWTLEELVEALEIPTGYGSIVRARRLNRKTYNSNGSPTWIPTQTVVLTFSGQRLPSHVYCFFTSLPVETYVLPTIQCNKCCRFGHIQTQCRSEARCFICAQAHEGISCTKEIPTCLYCSGCHKATDPLCPEQIRQKHIKLAMSQDNVSYSEASARFAQVRRSFADTARADIRGFQPSPTPHYASPYHLSPQLSPPQSIPYRKTVYTPRHQPLPASSPGFNQQAHRDIVKPPRSQLSNGCALPNTPSLPNDNLISLLLSTIINLLGRFSDVPLPNNVKDQLSQLLNLTFSNGSHTPMELPEQQE